MKRIIISLVLLSGISIFFVGCNGDSDIPKGTDVSKLFYIDPYGGLTVKDRSKLPSKLTIPSEINGIEVTSIGNSAFNGCSSLTSIVFAGTKAQWNAIVKGLWWKYDVPAAAVVCSDGEVAI